jgi:hypothetical protein
MNPTIFSFFSSRFGSAWAALLLAAGPAVAQERSAPAPHDYSSFRLITEKNIFNGSRSARGVPPPTNLEPRRAPQVDAFTLVGTMEYEKGPFAFFDGTRAAYQAVLPPGGLIAGFQVTAIANQKVKLEDQTNRFELHVGAQLRREDDGPWQLREQGDLLASAGRGSQRSDFGRRDTRTEDARRGDTRTFDNRTFDNRRWGGQRGNEGRGGSGAASVAATPAPSASAAVKLTPAEEEEVLKRLMQQREQETK